MVLRMSIVHCISDSLLLYHPLSSVSFRRSYVVFTGPLSPSPSPIRIGRRGVGSKGEKGNRRAIPAASVERPLEPMRKQDEGRHRTPRLSRVTNRHSAQRHTERSSVACSRISLYALGTGKSGIFRAIMGTFRSTCLRFGLFCPQPQNNAQSYRTQPVSPYLDDTKGLIDRCVTDGYHQTGISEGELRGATAWVFAIGLQDVERYAAALAHRRLSDTEKRHLDEMAPVK